MSAIAISAVGFASIFGATLLGMLLRSMLPERYPSAGSKEVVTLGIGLIATMSAGSITRHDGEADGALGVFGLRDARMLAQGKLGC